MFAGIVCGYLSHVPHNLSTLKLMTPKTFHIKSCLRYVVRNNILIKLEKLNSNTKTIFDSKSIRKLFGWFKRCILVLNLIRNDIPLVKNPVTKPFLKRAINLYVDFS